MSDAALRPLWGLVEAHRDEIKAIVGGVAGARTSWVAEHRLALDQRDPVASPGSEAA